MVIEINRPDRKARRLKGKSDPVDAEAAARAVLSGEANVVPKSRDGRRAGELLRLDGGPTDGAVATLRDNHRQVDVVDDDGAGADTRASGDVRAPAPVDPCDVWGAAPARTVAEDWPARCLEQGLRLAGGAGLSAQAGADCHQAVAATAVGSVEVDGLTYRVLAGPRQRIRGVGDNGEVGWGFIDSVLLGRADPLSTAPARIVVLDGSLVGHGPDPGGSLMEPV